MDLRETGAKALTDVEANNLFAAYLTQIERVIEVVNNMPGASGGNNQAKAAS